MFWNKSQTHIISFVNISTCTSKREGKSMHVFKALGPYCQTTCQKKKKLQHLYSCQQYKSLALSPHFYQPQVYQFRWWGWGWELNTKSSIVVIADREPVTILEKLKGLSEAASSQGLPTCSPVLERQRMQVWLIPGPGHPAGARTLEGGSNLLGEQEPKRLEMPPDTQRENVLASSLPLFCWLILTWSQRPRESGKWVCISNPSATPQTQWQCRRDGTCSEGQQPLEALWASPFCPALFIDMSYLEPPNVRKSWAKAWDWQL